MLTRAIRAPLIASAILVACASCTGVRTNQPVPVEQLDQLERGASTRQDVEKVLGVPNGSGHAVFPTDHEPLEIWFYQDIESELVETGLGSYQVHGHQRLLLVMFRNDVFDGFMWWALKH